jgi:glucosamine 6-phosphate synthetase-like amidotransferase/phosphosugar isomerase protein
MAEQNWDMYDYILESKEAVRNIVANREQIFAGALAYLEGKIIDQIYILGSGTSYHSAVAAKKLAEDILDRKVINMYPMEFVDNEKVFNDNTLVIGISHAGRSSSTIAALDKARKLGLYTISMTAEKDRPITEHADANVYIEIGDEFAGPKTKGFIGSIATIQILAMMYAKQLGNTDEKTIESLCAQMLETTDQIPDIAAKAWDWYKANKADLLKCRRLIVLGYDACMASMLEGTLKILEAVRYSVTGYELEEFMHGVYHSIDENTYMLYLGMKGRHYDRMRRMKTYFANERNAHNYEVTSETGLGDDARNFVYPFRNHEYFAAMEYVIPCQVIARKLSLDLGIDCNISSDPDFHKKMGSYTY